MVYLPQSDQSRRTILRGFIGVCAGSGIAGTASGTGTRPKPGDKTDRTERRIVGVESERAARAVRQRATRVSREIDFGRIGYTVVGEFQPAVETELSAASAVRYMESEATVSVLGKPVPDVRVQSETTPWGVERIGAASVHEQETTGDGADIAIVDSGIDSDHPDLQANLGEGHAVTACDTCRREWDDDHDHGTHVAGIAAAVSNTTGVVGVSPAVTLHAVKAVTANGDGGVSTLAAGLKWAADQGYDVANLSLGSTEPSDVMHDAVRYATNRGMVVVAAAGNEEPDEQVVHYPAAYPEVIAVGATAKDDDLTDFSLTGDAVELLAPGREIPSTVIDGYDVYSGTSMATPHVAGGAALLAANGYSPSEIRTRLQETTEDLGLDDDEQGYGLLDVDTALDGAGGTSDRLAARTDSATQLEPTAMTLNGRLVGLGDHDSAAVGFEYWKTDDKSTTARTADSADRSSVGPFSVDLTELAPETTYSFRARAATSTETVTGTVQEVTTPAKDTGGGSGLPAVETGMVTNITDDEATVTGQVTEMGAATEVEPGFEYWIEGRKAETLDDDDTWDIDEPDAYEVSLSFLEPATTYVVVARAVDDDDETTVVRGDPVTFTTTREDGTAVGQLAVTTNQPTAVGATEATLTGKVTGLGGADAVETGFRYWESENRSSTMRTVTSGDQSKPGAFDVAITGLAAETTYSAVAIGSVDGTEVSGAVREFTTPSSDDGRSSGSLAVETVPPTGIEDDEATLRGRITDFGDANELEPGFEYWIEGRKDETLDDADAWDMETPGFYTESINFLQPDTTYVARARVVDDDGARTVRRGNPIRFTTNKG